MIHKLFLFALGVVFVGGLSVLIVQFFFVAPYGRHSRRGWGPAVPDGVAWMMTGLVPVLVMGIFYVTTGRGILDPAILFLSLWMFAYIYRGGIYPWAIRRTNRALPAILVLAGMIMTATGAFINGYSLFSLPFSYLWSDLLTSRRLAGLSLFLVGFSLHLWSDLTLGKLRRADREVYQMPTTGPFRLVSSPNYLGVILQWTGWAVLTWNLPGLAVAWLSFAFLFPRAIANHRWYKRTFPDYPKARRAFLPLVM